MLSTERLIVRPFLEGDYEDLYEYLSLKETYQYEPGEPVSLKEAKKIASERAKGTDFRAVTLKGRNQKLIGHISFIQIEPKLFFTWEIGFIFNPAFQGKGYASEVTRAVIEYAFTESGAHRIIGFCSTRNIPAWRVLEKCGMKREGVLRKSVFFHKDKNGQPIWLDSYGYAILAENFLKNNRGV